MTVIVCQFIFFSISHWAYHTLSRFCYCSVMQKSVQSSVYLTITHFAWHCTSRTYSVCGLISVICSFWVEHSHLSVKVPTPFMTGCGAVLQVRDMLKIIVWVSILCVYIICVCVCVCVSQWNKAPDEWQARQAILAILQVSSRKQNAKKYKRKRPASLVDHCHPYRRKKKGSSSLNLHMLQSTCFGT